MRLGNQVLRAIPADGQRGPRRPTVRGAGASSPPATLPVNITPKTWSDEQLNVNQLLHLENL